MPSFARQTGMTCEACHTVFPELNHFGRMFKANAYTLDNLNQVRGITPTKQEMLDLAGLPPLSVMVQISDTQLSKSLPDGTGGPGHSQTNTVGFPQQLSIFYAGKIAPHLGAMIQLTYADDSGTVGIDNTDVRFANNVILPQETNLVYGVSLNTIRPCRICGTARRRGAFPMHLRTQVWRHSPQPRSTADLRRMWRA